MNRIALGELEHLVLLAILRLGDQAYGVTIIDEIALQTGRSITQASAYLTLRRLEKKGWISSRTGEPTPELGGRAKRYFWLEPHGLHKLSRTRTALENMWAGFQHQLDNLEENPG